MPTDKYGNTYSRLVKMISNDTLHVPSLYESVPSLRRPDRENRRQPDAAARGLRVSANGEQILRGDEVVAEREPKRNRPEVNAEIERRVREYCRRHQLDPSPAKDYKAALQAVLAADADLKHTYYTS